MLSFSKQYEDEQADFSACQQLVAMADQIGVDTGCAFGLSADMETEQLASIRQVLKEAVDEELARRKAAELMIPVCNIGPYEDGYCTICGGRDPSCDNRKRA